MNKSKRKDQTTINIRVKASKKELMKHQAELDGRSLSNWILHLADQEIEQRQKEEEER